MKIKYSNNSPFCLACNEKECNISKNGLMCSLLRFYDERWMHEKLGENCLKNERDERDGNQINIF
jgi:hypothetical protein